MATDKDIINDIENVNILDIPDDTRYWFVRANSQAQYYNDFLINNYIAVDSNGIGLDELLSISTAIRSAPSALNEKYKSIFQQHALQEFDNNPINKKKDKSTLKKDRKTEITRSTNRANRVYHFVEDFNIGDFIVIPYKSSAKFLIGIVISDSFTSEIDHTEILDDNGEMTYDVSSFHLKRRVLWIKELNRSSFPDKLSWIRNAHQSIFEFTDDANELNPYINPFYKYRNYYYVRIGVNTTEKISSSSWLHYQLVIKNIVGQHLDDVYQKQKVQSPGDIIQYVTPENLALLIVIISCLFGEVTITKGPVKIKLQGVFRYFSKGERLKRKLEAENVLADFETKKATIQNTDADTLKKLSELGVDTTEEKEALSETSQRIINALNNRYSENQTKITRGFSSDTITKNLAIPDNLQKDEIGQVQDKFKLSNENPGSAISFETQEDNLSPSMDEFQTETIEGCKELDLGTTNEDSKK